jgi:hypothetical protein
LFGGFEVLLEIGEFANAGGVEERLGGRAEKRAFCLFLGLLGLLLLLLLLWLLLLLLWLLLLLRRLGFLMLLHSPLLPVASPPL